MDDLLKLIYSSLYNYGDWLPLELPPGRTHKSKDIASSSTGVIDTVQPKLILPIFQAWTQTIS